MRVGLRACCPTMLPRASSLPLPRATKPPVRRVLPSPNHQTRSEKTKPSWPGGVKEEGELYRLKRMEAPRMGAPNR